MSIIGDEIFLLLYRIISKNILKFWRWGDYLVKEKYKLPVRLLIALVSDYYLQSNYQ